LLTALGLPFAVVVSDAPETLDPGTAPETQAVVLAQRKARAVAASLQDGLVLGADTIVVLDADILGKPENDADAARMLRLLSGQRHQVITGLALVAAATGASATSTVTSTVQFLPLSDDEIARYVASEEPLDKAGAYAIQGRGAALIAGFEGCYTNIVGLPLCETARLLIAAGLPVPAASPICRLPDGAPCPRLV
jgi:septum formation protein